MSPFPSGMEFWLAVSCENLIVTAAVSGEGCKRIWREGVGVDFIETHHIHERYLQINKTILKK